MRREIWTCDRCGAAIERDAAVVATVGAASPREAVERGLPFTGPEDYDLCPDCARALAAVLDGAEAPVPPEDPDA